MMMEFYVENNNVNNEITQLTEKLIIHKLYSILHLKFLRSRYARQTPE